MSTPTAFSSSDEKTTVVAVAHAEAHAEADDLSPREHAPQLDPCVCPSDSAFMSHDTSRWVWLGRGIFWFAALVAAGLITVWAGWVVGDHTVMVVGRIVATSTAFAMVVYVAVVMALRRGMRARTHATYREVPVIEV